jgi:hypothetical protein
LLLEQGWVSFIGLGLGVLLYIFFKKGVDVAATFI